MSTTTQRLGLFKYDTVADSQVPFNIDDALNYNWDILEQRVGSSRNIGEVVASSLPLTDAGLHLLDGSLILGSGIYNAFVDYIAGLYGDGTNVPSYFCTEADWQTAVSTYGVCGKFVYSPSTTYYCWGGELYTTVTSGSDVTVYTKNGNLFDVIYDSSNSSAVISNGTLTVWIDGVIVAEGSRDVTRDAVSDPTVRLPKITGILEGTTDVTAIGDLIEQYVKLPNISGTFQSGGLSGSAWDSNVTSTSGVFGRTGLSQYASSGTNTSKGSYYLAVDFYASRASSVYSGNGSDTKIQQQAIKVLYYIVITTQTKTDIEVDIDEIATDLNGKLDVNGSNCSSKLSDDFLNRIIPEYSNASKINLNSLSTYTAPSAGYVVCGANVLTNGYRNVYVNGVWVGSYSSNTTNIQSTCSFYVSKGDVITASAALYGACSFFPLKGAD